MADRHADMEKRLQAVEEMIFDQRSEIRFLKEERLKEIDNTADIKKDLRDVQEQNRQHIQTIKVQNAEIASQNRRIEADTKTIKKQNDEIIRLTTENGKYSKEIEAYKKLLAEQEAELQSLKDGIGAADEKVLKKIKEKDDEISSLKAAVEKLENENKELQNKVAKKKKMDGNGRKKVIEKSNSKFREYCICF